MAVNLTARRNGALVEAHLTGTLAMADTANVLTGLLRCVTEQPAAVIVDLAGLTVEEPLALTALLAMDRQADRWPGVPLLLAAPAPHTAELLGTAAYRRIPIFADTAAARDHAARMPADRPSMTAALPPAAASCRRGRELVTRACARWSLPALTAPAGLIVTELISNVVRHARTDLTVRLTRWDDRLFMAVRDGDTTEPPTAVRMPEPGATGGRGLIFVASTSDSWGCLPALGGKVVWASLRVPH